MRYPDDFAVARRKERAMEDATTDELRECLAAIEHERWASWQRWMHAQCERYGDGALLIPADLAARWDRQIATPYAELSEAERASNREQVDRYWPLIQGLARKAAAWDRLRLVLHQHALWPDDAAVVRRPTMTDPTAADLARLDALDAAATPGPWAGGRPWQGSMIQRAEGAAVPALVATVRDLARAIVATDDRLSCFWCDYVYGEEHHPDCIVRRARALLGAGED